VLRRGAREDGRPADTEAALRRFRRIYFNRDGLRRAIAEVVNKTLEVRDAMLWGEGTACASDSKQFGSRDSNLMTEWHARYGGPGVMVYWHVERKQLCIYGQLTTCSASEVAAMLQPPPRHRRGDRDEHHRPPRRVDHRLRVLRAARLPLDAALQAVGKDASQRPRTRYRQAADGDRAGHLRPPDQTGS
jgi:hypothetical protein